MKNYSRKTLKTKKVVTLFVILFVILLIACVSYVIFLNTNNYITYSNYSNDAALVSDNVAKNSKPIIVNNIIVGAVYENTFVDKARYMNLSENKENLDISLYGFYGKYGDYTIKNIQFGNNANYITTNRLNIDEYYATYKDYNSVNYLTEVLNYDSKVKEYVKEALGMYSILNSSIEIFKVYSFNNNYIIAATSEKNSNSAYSCIVYVEKGNVKLLKYNFVHDKSDSEDFGIITPKFVCDLNGDSNLDLIIQETKEFETEYIVIDNMDKEVLSVNIK